MNPSTSVIVCTRDRPDSFSVCLSSLRQACPAEVQVVVVDQSSDRQSAAVVERVCKDGFSQTLTYEHSQRRGLSSARNDGVAQARGDVLLFTDDDCEVAANWVTEWWAILGGGIDVGIAFGRTTAEVFDPRSGHTPNFDPGCFFHAWGRELLRRGASAVGMGANMMVRREVLETVGGFDEQLGAGAAFPAAEEIDLACRMVRAGYRIGHAGGPTVLHHGHRARADASELAMGYAAATGAMYSKHIRSGDIAAVYRLALEMGRLTSQVARRLISGTRPLGFNSLVGLLKGSVRSTRSPVDRANCLYLSDRPIGRGGPRTPQRARS